MIIRCQLSNFNQNFKILLLKYCINFLEGLYITRKNISNPFSVLNNQCPFFLFFFSFFPCSKLCSEIDRLNSGKPSLPPQSHLKQCLVSLTKFNVFKIQNTYFYTYHWKSLFHYNIKSWNKSLFFWNRSYLRT